MQNQKDFSEIQDALLLLEKEYSFVKNYQDAVQTNYRLKLQEEFLNSAPPNEIFADMLERMESTVQEAQKENPEVSVEKIKKKFIQNEIKNQINFIVKTLRPEFAAEIDAAAEKGALEIQEAIQLLEEERQFISEQREQGFKPSKAHKQFLKQHSNNQEFVDFIKAEDEFIKSERIRGNLDSVQNLREHFRYTLGEIDAFKEQSEILLGRVGKV